MGIDSGVPIVVGGGGGRLFKGYYFKYFRQIGAIIQGMRLIEDGYYSRKYGCFRKPNVGLGTGHYLSPVVGGGGFLGGIT